MLDDQLTCPCGCTICHDQRTTKDVLVLNATCCAGHKTITVFILPGVDPDEELLRRQEEELTAEPSDPMNPLALDTPRWRQR